MLSYITKTCQTKTIKYFFWEGYAKNAVGDIVENKIGGNVSLAGKILDLLDLEKQVAVVGTASFTIGQLKNLS